MEGVGISAINKLKQHFKGNFFKLTDALKIGVKKWEFYKLIETEQIEKVAHGLYQLESELLISLEDQFRSATKLINSKSAICLQSALSFYDLTDEIIEEPTLLVDNKVTSHLETIKLFRKRTPHWDVGIVNKEGFSITSLERTIVECAVYKTHAGFEGVQAIKKSILGKTTTANKIYEISKKLGYEKKLLPYLEVFI